MASFFQVTCKAKFEKYVVQAQDKAYFFVERDPNPDFLRYRFGYALALPTTKMNGLFNHTLYQHWFRFQPKVVVATANTLRDAFERADALISKTVKDGWLHHM